MPGYETEPAELVEAAKTLDDGAEEVNAALAELTDGAGPGLGPGGIDAAADAVLREQDAAVQAIRDDLQASATSAREVSERYLRLEDDVSEQFEQARRVDDV
jgi:hypothetical protein